MARPKSKREYDDDDEIDNSIREFQKGIADQPTEEDNTPEHIPGSEVANDEASGGTTPDTGDIVGSPTRAPEPIPPVVQDDPEPEPIPPERIPRCSCKSCGKPWNIVRGRVTGPKCGCMIHPHCVVCDSCEPHCKCRKS